MKSAILLVAATAGLFAASLLPISAADWQPVAGHILSPWAKDVSPDNVLPEYPRPMMVRAAWQNLNGLWDYAITPENNAKPDDFDGKILVPFPVESALSGVKRRVGAANRLWYRRTFRVPPAWKDQRVLLHFGAVDWEAKVSVNGRDVGMHQGCYDPFSFDITGALKAEGDQELVVSVWDPTDDGPQPRGKQVKEPGGIWYTPVTGIWQTPWLEPVSATHVQSIKITPDLDESSVTIQARGIASGGDLRFQVEILDGDRVIQEASLDTVVTTRSLPPQFAPTIKLPVPDAKPWTPDSPHLYDLRLTLFEDGRRVDACSSYFGLRKMALARDDAGVLRMQLNNQTVFQFGPLDQGWWPDGLYTAPTDEALRYDIEMTKKLGFNLARKHVKVEPARWYYWCDKLGLLVWQDMPNGDKSAPWRGPSGIDGQEMQRTAQSRAIYEKEWKAIIDANYNHPSIVVWVPFNEGWGQFDTVRILNWTMDYDPTRLVDGPSGGNHFPAGHIIDHHQYPGPGAPPFVTDRAMVLGEFGGLGLPLPGHTWQDQSNWGYRNFETADAVAAAYKNLLRKLHPMIRDNGLSAAIYTQTTDVEVEVNGLMTYDRAVVKLPPERIADANRKLYGPPPPPPQITVLSPSSKDAPHEWAYSTEPPPENWAASGFDDSGWKRGRAGFGTEMTPNSVVRTEWNTPSIWIRRVFEAPEGFKPHELQLHLFHDEDARVFLNGQLIAELGGYVTSYDYVILDDRAAQALQEGRNTLAVTCRQTRGGQYIDVGLVDVEEVEGSSATR